MVRGVARGRTGRAGVKSAFCIHLFLPGVTLPLSRPSFERAALNIRVGWPPHVCVRFPVHDELHAVGSAFPCEGTMLPQ